MKCYFLAWMSACGYFIIVIIVVVAVIIDFVFLHFHVCSTCHNALALMQEGKYCKDFDLLTVQALSPITPMY